MLPGSKSKWCVGRQCWRQGVTLGGCFCDATRRLGWAAALAVEAAAAAAVALAAAVAAIGTSEKAAFPGTPAVAAASIAGPNSRQVAGKGHGALFRSGPSSFMACPSSLLPSFCPPSGLAQVCSCPFLLPEAGAASGAGAQAGKGGGGGRGQGDTWRPGPA